MKNYPNTPRNGMYRSVIMFYLNYKTRRVNKCKFETLRKARIPVPNPLFAPAVIRYDPDGGARLPSTPSFCDAIEANSAQNLVEMA